MRSRVLAVLLSLVAPGAGHFLLGERLRATIFAVLASLVLLAFPFAPGPVLWTSLVLRVVAIADATLGVRTIQPTRVAGAAIAGAAPIAVVAALWMVALGFYKVPSSSNAPTENIGQHVVVNKLAYVLGEPARGEVIVFANPCTPQKSFIKRIVAVGGDSVEVRCNIVYVNDVAVPSEVVQEACTYDDYDDVSRRWARPGCSRYREHLGGHTYDVLHAEYRPAEDRAGGATYFDADDGTRGRADDHDFPELPDPGFARLHALDTEPRMPRCPNREPLGAVEVLPEPADPCGPRARYRVPAGTVFTLGDNRQNSSDSRVWGPVPVGAITGEVVLVWGSGGP